MAEGFNEKFSPGNGKNPSDVENSDNEESMIPDLGVENIRSVDKKSQSNEKDLNDVPKREENPFSFKHFLNRSNDSPNNYHNQGARPKIYTPQPQVLDVNHGNITENHQPRITSEFSSALPDFVQDHLVIEQCYLGNDVSPKEITVDLDNLPDFTPDKSNQNRWKENARGNDRRNTNTPSNLPLDLPARPRVEFPLDLPLTESQASGTRSCPQSSESWKLSVGKLQVGVSKSLPDFLSDGAVFQPEDNSQIGQSPERESDRLRRELELCRRQLMEATRRADQLQRQLDNSKDREREYTQNLAKALEQVEENLNISNRRAMSAENTVTKLKQEVNKLSGEVTHLQRENRALRGEEGAAGGPSCSYIPTSMDVQAQMFAQELRTAASTAEHSLRKLLGGVDNLRMMATSLESMYRIEERTDSYMSDFSEDTGPAL